MRYEEFKALVEEKGWTMEQLRCDVPPDDDLLDLMDRVGLDRYQRFVIRMESETK